MKYLFWIIASFPTLAYEVSIYDSRKDNTMVVIEYINNRGDVHKLYIKKDMLDKSDKIIIEWIKNASDQSK